MAALPASRVVSSSVTPPVPPELLPALLGGPERILGAGRDEPRFQLRDRSHLLENEPPGWPLDLRQVAEAHVYAALQDALQEPLRASQPVHLGDDQGDAMHPRHVERPVQLWSVIPAPALDLGELP